MEKADTCVLEDDHTSPDDSTIEPNEAESTKRKLDEDVKKDPDLPKELKAMFGALRCELCGVSSPSPMTALTHYKGKSHNRRVLNYLRERGISQTPPTKRFKGDTLELPGNCCKICNVVFTSEITKIEHLSGKKHRHRLFSGAKIEPLAPAVCDSSGRFGIGTGFKPTEETDDESKKLLAQSNPTHCSLCHISVSAASLMEAHLIGIKHKKRLAVAVAVAKGPLEETESEK